MIKIKNAVLHIFDFSSDLFIYSQEELDIQDNKTFEFVSKHIEKSSIDTSLMVGSFNADSDLKQEILAYENSEVDFLAFAKQLAERIYKAIVQSDTDKSLDIIICDYEDEFNNNYIAILECNNAVAYTHYVSQEADTVKNEIINHYAILPNTSQKLNSYVQINKKTNNIKFFDKKRYVNGKNIYIYPNLVLQASYQISSKDAVKIVKKLVNKVADNHGSNSAIAVSKAKTYILENAETHDEVRPVDIGNEVFKDCLSMREEFTNEIQKAGVPVAVAIDKEFAEKTAKSHKIKTDTGIELSVPADYFNNSDFIEFINNPDGTISIELKNINKIQNK